jgi:hypothetical protein
VLSVFVTPDIGRQNPPSATIPLKDGKRMVELHFFPPLGLYGKRLIKMTEAHE